jgi:radical SAM protein with 4Fe4S-binding SPASM domain
VSESNISSIPLSEFSLWEKIKSKRAIISFCLEITARCNNDCKHCYINLPAGDKRAKESELTIQEIGEIADEAVSLGAIWCLITGGEPLLREDFADIYLLLKRKGLLISVFTNAALINNQHMELFKKYPPRDIEISVYGATKETYEKVTRKPGSFDAFINGLNLLLESGVKVRLKAMALRSNYHEMDKIADFCREKTKDYYRFDPMLHLRFDGDESRNKKIISERLLPEEIAELEKRDKDRFRALQNECDRLVVPDFSNTTDNRLFHCDTGSRDFTVSYDGVYRLCSSLWHPDCIYNLREGSVTDAWFNFVPRVRSMKSKKKEYLQRCNVCPIVNLCLWCPAHAYLETGELDMPVDYFCKIAHARESLLEVSK